ncbi:MAG: hypothetical protein AAGH40_13810 [Verrucomicrobiota bacterium]
MTTPSSAAAPLSAHPLNVMFKKTHYIPAVAATTFGIGLVVGFLLPRPDNPNGEETISAYSRDQAQDESVANEENLDDKIHVIEKTVYLPSKIEEAELVKDRVRILQQFPKAVQFPGFGQSLEIDPACREILGMSDVEVLQVERLLARSKEKMDQYHTANLRLIEEDENHTVFELPASEQGRQNHHEFEESIQSILGSERAEIFLKQSKNEVTRSFSNFGTVRTEIEIKTTDDIMFSVKQSYFDENGRRFMSTTMPQTASLPRRYQSALEVTEPGAH